MPSRFSLRGVGENKGICTMFLFMISFIVILFGTPCQGVSTEGPYGSWLSPISSKKASDSSVYIMEIHVDPTTPDTLYWSEYRPAEDGRHIVFSGDIKDSSSDPVRWTPDDKNAKDRVYNYGGGDFFVNRGNVYFSNYEDQQIYKQSPGGTPVPITVGENGYYRYADGRFSGNKNFFFVVREERVPDADQVHTIVAINVKSGEQTVIASGYDFYAYPRVSPDGTKLVWMQWKHPNMPWDDTELWLGDITASDTSISVGNKRKVAGKDNTNFMEPRWNSDGKLFYISDETGWWNLYVTNDFTTFKSRNLLKKDAEIGTPAWTFGHMSYSPHPTNAKLVAVIYHGKASILNIKSGKQKKIDMGDYIAKRCLFQPDGDYLIIVATSPIKPQCIFRYDMNSKQLETLYQPMEDQFEGYLSLPREVMYPVDNGQAFTYGYYYKPTNKDFHAPAGTLPPLIINVHGGPTSSASLSMNLEKQYFTSRGIAILDVNYRGSSGFGTPYRKALYGNWGLTDIEDVAAGATYMATTGIDGEKVNKDQLLISGGSAGGYTALAALTFRKVFAAGVSYYGVSDLATLAAGTHKFESKYLDQLIAPYPEGVAIFDARSPIKHLDTFNTACAFFQGLLDQVVPPDQTREMYQKIFDKGVPCSMVLFPDEGHGFYQSENLQKSLDGEFYFYSKILSFTAADQGIEIPIENLPDAAGGKRNSTSG